MTIKNVFIRKKRVARIKSISAMDLNPLSNKVLLQNENRDHI